MLTPFAEKKASSEIRKPEKRHPFAKSDLDSSRLPSPLILQKDSRKIQNPPSAIAPITLSEKP